MSTVTAAHPRRVAIITSGYLPVPNVLGGAVEALSMMLIRENDNNPLFDFTVLSAWVPGVEDAASGIAHTSFRFIKPPSIVKAADHCVYWAAKHLLHKKKLMSYRYIAQRLWYIRKVAEQLSRDNFDAVMIENHPTLFMVLKRFGNAERYAGKVYYHLHNEVTNDFGCAHEIASVRKVLGVSNYVLGTLDRFLREHGEGGLKPEQRAVWRNCVDTDVFNPENPVTQHAGVQWRKKLGIAANETVFLFSGRLTPEKGATELLRAFLQADIPDARLVIAGAFFFDSKIASPFERQLHQMAEQAGQRILFTGFVDYGQMPGIYAMADVCCLPSIWDDPAPLAVIESLASGRPLITTRSGGIPEYADNSDSVIFERDDRQLVKAISSAMWKFASDSAQRDAMGEYGIKTVRDLESMQYLKQLNKVCNE